ERVVRRNGAVVLESKRLAGIACERLRLHAQAVVVGPVTTALLFVAADPIAVADRGVQHAVRTEEDAAHEIAALLPGVGDEDLFHVGERRSVEAPARDRQRGALWSGLRMRQ